MRDWKREIMQRFAERGLESTLTSEVAEELAQHGEDRYEELVARGETEAEAFRSAIAELMEGDVTGAAGEKPGAPRCSELRQRRCERQGPSQTEGQAQKDDYRHIQCVAENCARRRLRAEVPTCQERRGC